MPALDCGVAILDRKASRQIILVAMSFRGTTDMTKRKDPAAVRLGRKGGRSRSKKKIAAVLDNLRAAWNARRKGGR